MNLKYAIALTGGIGSGKSTVANLLSLYGYCVIDADKIAHQLLEENQEHLVHIFSKEILDESFKIDRKKLGKIVFANPQSRKQLEDFLHPQIRSKILASAKELEIHQKFYFLDIPLFFEIGGRESYGVDKVLLVYVSSKMQLERIIGRDSLEEMDALMRINAQIDIETKKKWSDYIIDNSGNLKTLQKEVEKFLHRLNEDFIISNKVL